MMSDNVTRVIVITKEWAQQVCATCTECVENLHSFYGPQTGWMVEHAHVTDEQFIASLYEYIGDEICNYDLCIKREWWRVDNYELEFELHPGEEYDGPDMWVPCEEKDEGAFPITWCENALRGER